jgi:hypothetical protein
MLPHTARQWITTWRESVCRMPYKDSILYLQCSSMHILIVRIWTLRKDNITMGLTEICLKGVGWNNLGGGGGPVAASCEHGNEPSGSIKGGEFLDQLSDHWIPRKVPAPWSYLGIRQWISTKLVHKWFIYTFFTIQPPLSSFHSLCL